MEYKRTRSYFYSIHLSTEVNIRIKKGTFGVDPAVSKRRIGLDLKEGKSNAISKGDEEDNRILSRNK